MDIYSPLVLLTASDGSTVKLQLNSTGTATYSVGGNVWLPISKDRVISGGEVVPYVAGEGIKITGNTISAVLFEDLR